MYPTIKRHPKLSFVHDVHPLETHVPWRRQSFCLFSGDFNAYRGRHLVVLHPHHYLVLHSKPRCLPHGRKDDHSHRERGGSSRADRNRIRNPGGWLHHDVLQGEDLTLMPTSNVVWFICHYIYYIEIGHDFYPSDLRQVLRTVYCAFCVVYIRNDAVTEYYAIWLPLQLLFIIQNKRVSTPKLTQKKREETYVTNMNPLFQKTTTVM